MPRANKYNTIKYHAQRAEPLNMPHCDDAYKNIAASHNRPYAKIIIKEQNTFISEIVGNDVTTSLMTKWRCGQNNYANKREI